MSRSAALLRGAVFVMVASVAATAASPTPVAAQDEVQGVVTGVVQTADGSQPLPHATVSVPQLSRSVTADAAGRFRLTGVRSGTHRLEVRAIGYQPAWQSVSLAAGDSVVVALQLKRATVTLPDVIVSSSREEQAASATALSVGVVEKDDIDEARAHHPAEIVNRVPGVYVSNFGGEGHATSIRQPITTKALYAYLEDGVPIRSTGFFNHNALYEINLPQAGRIEVIRGPGSAVYGSDAVGGVVNAFTRDPSSRPEAELYLEGGSRAYLRALGSASTTSGANGLRADLNVTRSDGWRRDTPYQRQSGTLRWDHHLSNQSRIKTVATFSHIDQPGDGGSDLTASDYTNVPSRTYAPIAFRRVTAARLSTEFQAQRELSSFGVILYGRYNELDLLPSWQLSFDPQIWESIHRSVGVLSRWRQAIVPLHTSLSAGLDLEYSPGSRLETQIIAPRDPSDNLSYPAYTAGAVQYDYNVDFWQVAPYAQADIDLPGRVRLSAGARYDRIGYNYDNHLTTLTTGSHRRPASTDVAVDRLNPKLGVSWEITPSAMVFGSYREAFRAPSESQYFRQGAAESTVDLKPVRAQSWELGTRTAIGGIATVEVSAYHMRLKDDILTFQDPSNGLRLTQNAGATKHRGIEVGVGISPVRQLRLDAAAAVAKHSYVTWVPRPTSVYSGNEMELAPRVLGNVRATYRPTFLETGFFAVEWTRTGSYWMDPENTRKYDGHDLFTAFTTIPVSPRVELSGRVTNIGNRRFAETSSFTATQQDRYRPGAPRQFFLGLQYRFQ